MRRVFATVELTEEEDGTVSARVSPTGKSLDDDERRAAVRAVAVALELAEDEAEWDAAWSAEVARRRDRLATGQAGTVSARDVIARLTHVARAPR